MVGRYRTEPHTLASLWQRWALLSASFYTWGATLVCLQLWLSVCSAVRWLAPTVPTDLVLWHPLLTQGRTVGGWLAACLWACGWLAAWAWWNTAATAVASWLGGVDFGLERRTQASTWMLRWNGGLAWALVLGTAWGAWATTLLTGALFTLGQLWGGATSDAPLLVALGVAFAWPVATTVLLHSTRLYGRTVVAKGSAL